MPEKPPGASIELEGGDDAADVRAAREDPQAFARLYDRYVQPVYRYLLNRVGTAGEAEELTAQTFLAVLEGIHRYDHRGMFSAWLFSIARRKAADAFRRRTAVRLDEAEDVALEQDLPAESDRADEIRTLKRILGTLGEEESELIRLHFTAGLTFAEMGLLLGKKEDAVKKSTHRLIKRLQERME